MNHLRLAALCALIFVLAMASRLWQIQVESVWYDESVAAYELSPGIGLAPFLRQVAKNDEAFHPLYFTALWVWSRLFGTEILALRMFSVLLGSISVIFLYLIGKEVLDNRLAVITATAMGILSPPNIFYSQEIRMYAFFYLLISISVWGMVKTYKTGGRAALVLHLVANMLMVWTHLISLVFLFVQGLIILWLYGKNAKFLLKWGLPQVVNAVCVWVFWARFVDFNAIREGSDWIGASYSMNASLACLVFLRNISGLATTLYGKSLYVLIFLLTSLFLLKIIRERRVTGRVNRAEIAIGALAIVPVLVLYAVSKLVYPCLIDRYIMYTQTCAILAAVMGGGVLGRRAGALINGLLIVLFLAQFASVDRPVRLNWNKIISIVNDGRPVLVSPPHERQTLKPLALPPIGVDIPSFQDYLRTHAAQLHEKGGWFVKAGGAPGTLDPFLSVIESSGFSVAHTERVRGNFTTIQVYLIH